MACVVALALISSVQADTTTGAGVGVSITITNGSGSAVNRALRWDPGFAARWQEVARNAHLRTSFFQWQGSLLQACVRAHVGDRMDALRQWPGHCGAMRQDFVRANALLPVDVSQMVAQR